jgi:flagellar basal body-associated protein FliL
VSAGIVLVAAGAGYLAAHLSGFLARAGPAQAAAESPKPETETAPGAPEAKPEAKPEGEKGNSKAKEFAYFDFEPVIANLDEPRLARYVRVAVTLAIRADNLAAAGPVLEKKKPQLKHWLTVYFSSCKLDDVRGATNLNRIQREILDALNDELWPGQKPLIDQVLFKEFAVS